MSADAIFTELLASAHATVTAPTAEAVGRLAAALRRLDDLADQDETTNAPEPCRAPPTVTLRLACGCRIEVAEDDLLADIVLIAVRHGCAL